MATLEKRKKYLGYGDFMSHVWLWQKAFLMVPIWAIPIVPVFGFVCRTLGGSVNQAGFGAVVGLSVLYFLQDLLKRVISLDDDRIYFGFRSYLIRDAKSVDITYKKGKFLPFNLVVTFDEGKQLKLKCSALSEQSVETLLKHLQSRNSQLKTAAVLNTLVKCRSVNKKSLEVGERLDIAYNSREFITENIDAFKATAAQWARVGPVLAMVCAPIWLGYLPHFFSSLQANSYQQARELKLSEFFGEIFTNFSWAVGKGFSAIYDSSHAWIGNPLLIIFFSLAILVTLLSLLRVLLQPNALVANKNGLSLNLRVMDFAVPLSVVKWAEISSMSLKKIAGKSGELIVEQKNKRKFKLDLSAISPDDRGLLLKKVELMIPECPVSSELSQAMLPRADRSYTEIWLQSLTQSPERKTLDPLQPGQLIGVDSQFEVLHSIGVGGQGKAYLCRPLTASGEGSVVLKETIIPIFADSSVRRKSLESFEQEARLLKSIEHRGIVKLLDYFVEDHRAYLVLEHIDGFNLRQLVEREGALTEEKVLELAFQMLEILEFLHERGVVHRDFTPDNLILNSRGQLKLIDFNVAQQIQGGSSGTIVGKHAYLPPEQFRGKATTQSDIYALGATLFYLLTGTDPEPISQSSPAKLTASVSSGLDAIVKRSTSLQTTLRYQSAKELAKDLFVLSDGAAVALSPSDRDSESLDLSKKEELQEVVVDG